MLNNTKTDEMIIVKGLETKHCRLATHQPCNNKLTGDILGFLSFTSFHPVYVNHMGARLVLLFFLTSIKMYENTSR